MTKYVVLSLSPDEGNPEYTARRWIVESEQEARSAQAAIAASVNDASFGGTFIAVPLRSWRPVTVKVETKTSLKFS